MFRYRTVKYRLTARLHDQFVEIVAHRGVHSVAPENSLAAIEAAIDARIKFVEVDVRLGGDGELYLLHDSTLDRTTTGTGRLQRAGAETLRDALLSDGSRLPTVGDVLDVAKGKITLCIDVKDAVAKELRRFPIRCDGTVQVWSSHRPVVAAWSSRVPTLAICSGLFRDGPGAFIWRARQDGAHAVSFYPADLEPHVAAACKNGGVAFLSGTPNDRGTWRALMRLGASGLITDRPIELRIQLGAWAASSQSVHEGTCHRMTAADIEPPAERTSTGRVASGDGNVL